MAPAFIFNPIFVNAVFHPIKTLPRCRPHPSPTLCLVRPRATLRNHTPAHSAIPNDFTPVIHVSSAPIAEEESSNALDPAYTGGAGSPPTGSHGRRGDGHSGDSEPDPSNDDALLEPILARHNATLPDIPQDILSAYRNGYIGPDNIANYFLAQANFFSRLLMRCGDGMRNRFLADKLFLLKILIEEGIGVFGKLSAEYEQRRANFWKEGEFVFANLITAILADFALVYLPAPSVALTRNLSGSGFGAWLNQISTTLPSNIFQTDRPFTVAQRFGGFALKASQLFVVGMMCCLVGSAMTNALVYIREKIDDNYVPKTKKPNVLAVSALYATFLGVSSGSRYQLVNGIESHVFPRIFRNTPRILEEMTTFVLRYGNTFWGSQQWVMFCRFTNVQKTKAE